MLMSEPGRARCSARFSEPLVPVSGPLSSFPLCNRSLEFSAVDLVRSLNCDATVHLKFGS